MNAVRNSNNRKATIDTIVIAFDFFIPTKKARKNWKDLIWLRDHIGLGQLRSTDLQLVNLMRKFINSFVINSYNAIVCIIQRVLITTEMEN